MRRAALAILTVASALLGPGRPVTLAQEPGQVLPGPVLVLVTGDPERVPTERQTTWRTHAERAARIAGHRLVDAEAWSTDRIRRLGTLSRDRVMAFREVETLLLRAREEIAALREGEALALLSRADRIAEAHADVPRAAAWIAEVQTAIGITAAQAGLHEVMEAAFARAATLDASRGVRAAEAPPHVKRRADAIAAAVATRPSGSFEVRVATPEARVYLDDEPLGRAPVLARAPVGQHVLRVESPGHLPWGRLVEVLEGRRPTVSVHLSPDPLVVLARRVGSMAETLDPTALQTAIATLGVAEIWIVEVGGGEADRALFTACIADGCGETRTIEVDEVPILVPAPQPIDAEVFTAALPTHRGWLDEPPPPPPAPTPEVPWWRRWFTLAAAGALLAGGIAGTVLLLRPEAGQQHSFDILCEESWCMPSPDSP